MGIDLYLEWENMLPWDRKKQRQAWPKINHGHVGYLREARVGPSALAVLVPELLDSDQETPPAEMEYDPEVLAARQDDALKAAAERHKKDPNASKSHQRSIIDFIDMYRRKHHLGLRPKVVLGQGDVRHE